jgi:hypothetical protein
MGHVACPLPPPVAGSFTVLSRSELEAALPVLSNWFPSSSAVSLIQRYDSVVLDLLIQGAEPSEDAYPELYAVWSQTVDGEGNVIDGGSRAHRHLMEEDFGTDAVDEGDLVYTIGVLPYPVSEVSHSGRQLKLWEDPVEKCKLEAMWEALVAAVGLILEFLGLKGAFREYNMAKKAVQKGFPMLLIGGEEIAEKLSSASFKDQIDGFIELVSAAFDLGGFQIALTELTAGMTWRDWVEFVITFTATAVALCSSGECNDKTSPYNE